VTVQRWVRFKIGRTGEFGAFVLTGRRAPSALISVEYSFRTSGDVSVCFGGTSIPSESCYFSRAREGLHDMIGNTAEGISDFLNAGSCKDAPAMAVLQRSRQCG